MAGFVGLVDTNSNPIIFNPNGQASMAASAPVVIASNQSAIPVSGTPFPAGATSVTGQSGNVAAAAAIATLPGIAARTTYITGFEVTSAGATTAAVVSVTVTGTISGTLTYTYATVAGATVGNAPLVVQFPVPIPASAVNTAIVVTLPSLGAGNTNATVVAHGYQI